MKCEAMALARIGGEYQQPVTRALLVGSFVDAYFGGTLPQFMQENPELFTRKNQLKSEFCKANDMIGRIKSDPLFMRFMSGEKHRIMVFEMPGVPGTVWKMKMDSYLEGICITDLKVVAEFRGLPLWRYDLQRGCLSNRSGGRNRGKAAILSGAGNQGAGNGPGYFPDSAVCPELGPR